jgi:hypothetical protein
MYTGAAGAAFAPQITDPLEAGAIPGKGVKREPWSRDGAIVDKNGNPLPSPTTRGLQNSALVPDPLQKALDDLGKVPTVAPAKRGQNSQSGVLGALKGIFLGKEQPQQKKDSARDIYVFGALPADDEKPTTGENQQSGANAEDTVVGKDGKPLTEDERKELIREQQRKAKAQADRISGAAADKAQSGPPRRKDAGMYMPGSIGSGGGGGSDDGGEQQQQQSGSPDQAPQRPPGFKPNAGMYMPMRPSQVTSQQPQLPTDANTGNQQTDNQNTDKKENPAEKKLKDEAGKQVRSQAKGFFRNNIAKLGNFLKLPAGCAMGTVAGIIALIIGIIVLIISIFAMIDATNETIAQQNTSGRSAAFFEYFGAAGGEGNNILQSALKPSVDYDGTPLRKVKTVRTQYGFKLNSLEAINTAFGGDSNSSIEVSQLELFINTTVPEGITYPATGNFSITEQTAIPNPFSATLPPNFSVAGGNSSEGARISFVPSICNSGNCQYQKDYNLWVELTFKDPVAQEAFDNGSGVMRATFGGVIQVKQIRTGQEDSFTSVPIYPPVTICVDMGTGQTRSCNSPVGDGRSTGGDTGSGTGSGQQGGTVDGFGCPFDQDAEKGVTLRCSQGYKSGHTAVDIQVREGNGTGAVRPDFNIRAPATGVLSEGDRADSPSCGHLLFINVSGSQQYMLAHVNLLPKWEQQLLAGGTPTVQQGEVLGTYYIPTNFAPNVTYNNKFLTGSPSRRDTTCWTGPHIHIEYRSSGGTQGDNRIYSMIEKSCNVGKAIVKDDAACR